MKIEIRTDSIHISGYVNAVGRDSRPITGATEKFVEVIEPAAFRASLERNPHVELLLNHNKERRLASTDEGTLRLEEDNIGLRAECDITDAEVIEKARKRELRGWSFGMYAIDTEKEERADNIPRRHVKKLDMFEVSLIDNTMRPAYAGTLVECRAEGAVVSETRSNDEETELLDYSKWEKKAAELAIAPYERRLEELRYNPYHDPVNGRFTDSIGGGWGGTLFVGKGQKGNGVYVINQDNFNHASNATVESDPNVKMDIIMHGLKASNIQYNEVQMLKKSLTTDEISDKLNGGDMTKGSCSSLAFAFIGNEAGYDVTDYRGGESQTFFARTVNIKQIVKKSGGIEFNGMNAIKTTMEALDNNVEEGKNYYLAVGQHAAIIRKKGGKYEYLEMQSRYSDRNGFHELTSKTLHDRFGAKRSRTIYGMKVEQSGVLIESEKLARNSDFKQMLGYINTSPNKQQKGKNGNVK